MSKTPSTVPREKKPIVDYETSCRAIKRLFGWAVSAILRGRKFFPEEFFQEALEKNGKVWTLVRPEKDEWDDIGGFERVMEVMGQVLTSIDKGYVQSFILEFHDPKDHSLVLEQWIFQLEELHSLGRLSSLGHKPTLGDRPKALGYEDFCKIVHELMRTILKVLALTKPFEYDKLDVRLGVSVIWFSKAKEENSIPPTLPEVQEGYEERIPNATKLRLLKTAFPYHLLEVFVKTSGYTRPSTAQGVNASMSLCHTNASLPAIQASPNTQKGDEPIKIKEEPEDPQAPDSAKENKTRIAAVQRILEGVKLDDKEPVARKLTGKKLVDNLKQVEPSKEDRKRKHPLQKLPVEIKQEEEEPESKKWKPVVPKVPVKPASKGPKEPVKRKPVVESVKPKQIFPEVAEKENPNPKRRYYTRNR